MKKKCAVVTGGTKNQFPAMAVLVINLIDKCPHLADDIIIFHDGISKKNQKKLKKVYPVKFIEWKSPFSKKTSFADTALSNYTSMVYCKYDCWNLLDEYETVIWTDYDVVILDDISELKEHDADSVGAFFKGNFLAQKIDRHIFRKPYFNELQKNVDLMGLQVSTGLFVIHDNFPDYMGFKQKCVDFTEKYSDVIMEPEEAVISILFQIYKYKIDELNFLIYCSRPNFHDPVLPETKILHAAAKPKFWDGLYNKDWMYYYNHIWGKKFHGQKFLPLQLQKSLNFIKKLLKCFIPVGFIKLINKLKKKF